MNKTIYEGRDSGLYLAGNFERFLRSTKDIEWVVGDVNPLHACFMVAHVGSPANATISYIHNGHDNLGRVKVSVYADTPEQIERVTEMIAMAKETLGRG